jgi:hypothetical protein
MRTARPATATTTWASAGLHVPVWRGAQLRLRRAEPLDQPGRGPSALVTALKTLPFAKTAYEEHEASQAVNPSDDVLAVCREGASSLDQKLIDQSRRKNLLYYRSLKWGTLSLSLENGDRYGDVLRLDCWLHNSCTIAPEQWLFAKQ